MATSARCACWSASRPGQAFAVDSQHRVPALGARRSDRRPAEQPGRGRPARRPDPRTARLDARRRSKLSAAKVVADHGPNPGHATKPLWLFQGTLNAPAANGHLGVHVLDGNHRALKAMLGQAQDQSFAYGRRTVFIKWQGRVPTLISPSQLTVGDRISVRIRARGNSSLGQVEATPANHVGEHEPASSS